MAEGSNMTGTDPRARIGGGGRPSGWSLWFAGCGLLIPGVWGFAFAFSGTREFLEVALVGSMVFGLPLFGFCVLGGTLAFAFLRGLAGWLQWRVAAERCVALAPFVVISVLLLFSAIRASLPRERFREIVGLPAPAGMKEIRVAGYNAFLAGDWIVAFPYDPGLVAGILARHGFDTNSPYSLEDALAKKRFLARLSWVTHGYVSTGAVEYFRREDLAPTPGRGRWRALVVDRETGRAWYRVGFQN